MTGYLAPDLPTTWKGRDVAKPPRGDNSRSAVLTADQVREIKRRLAAGEKATVIAADYPTTAKQVGRIKRREAWGHIKIEEGPR